MCSKKQIIENAIEKAKLMLILHNSANLAESWRVHSHGDNENPDDSQIWKIEMEYNLHLSTVPDQFHTAERMKGADRKCAKMKMPQTDVKIFKDFTKMTIIRKLFHFV